MCVIYACTSKLPSDDELDRGHHSNDDGAGLAWLDSGVVKFVKGLKNDDEVKKYIKDHAVPFPLAVHFRTASIGPVCPELCHPFPVQEDVPLDTEGAVEEVLFHNGHVASWEDYVLKLALSTPGAMPDGDWSDTRGLTYLVAHRGPGILRFVLGGSRALLFSATAYTPGGDAYSPSDHFTYYGTWIHKDGYSQSSDTGLRVLVGKASGVVLGSPYPVCAPQTTPTPTTLAMVKSDAVWTVGELTELLTSLEKEQADARITVG